MSSSKNEDNYTKRKRHVNSSDFIDIEAIEEDEEEEITQTEKGL